eukprot:28625_1
MAENDKKLWDVIKVTSSIIFNNVAIGNIIFKSFENNKWIQRDNIIDNLMQYKKGNIIDVISNTIKNDNRINDKWDSDKHNKMLYQLLLTVYKDQKVTRASILNEFIATLPQSDVKKKKNKDVTQFNECNPTQIIHHLVNIFKKKWKLLVIKHYKKN